MSWTSIRDSNSNNRNNKLFSRNVRWNSFCRQWQHRENGYPILLSMYDHQDERNGSDMKPTSHTSTRCSRPAPKVYTLCRIHHWNKLHRATKRGGRPQTTSRLGISFNVPSSFQKVATIRTNSFRLLSNLAGDRGLVNSLVLRDLYDIASNELWKDLTGVDPTHVSRVENDTMSNSNGNYGDGNHDVEAPRPTYSVMDHVL